MRRSFMCSVVLLILFSAVFSTGCSRKQESPDSEDTEDHETVFTLNTEAITTAVTEFIKPGDGIIDPETITLENASQNYQIYYGNGGVFPGGEETYWGVFEDTYSDGSGKVDYGEYLGPELVYEPKDYLKNSDNGNRLDSFLKRDGYVFAGWNTFQTVGDSYIRVAVWLKETDYPALNNEEKLSVVYSRGVRFSSGEEVIWTLWKEDGDRHIIDRNHPYPVFMKDYRLLDHVDNTDGEKLSDEAWIVSNDGKIEINVWFWNELNPVKEVIMK